MATTLNVYGPGPKLENSAWRLAPGVKEMKEKVVENTIYYPYIGWKFDKALSFIALTQPRQLSCLGGSVVEHMPAKQYVTGSRSSRETFFFINQDNLCFFAPLEV